jgi:hypothetical protein
MILETLSARKAWALDNPHLTPMYNELMLRRTVAMSNEDYKNLSATKRAFWEDILQAESYITEMRQNKALGKLKK